MAPSCPARSSPDSTVTAATSGSSASGAGPMARRGTVTYSVSLNLVIWSSGHLVIVWNYHVSMQCYRCLNDDQMTRLTR